jgi:hypothetical protein
MTDSFDWGSNLIAFVFFFIIFLASIYLLGLVYKPSLIDVAGGTVVSVNIVVALLVSWILVYLMYKYIKNKYPVQFCAASYQSLKRGCLQ